MRTQSPPGDVLRYHTIELAPGTVTPGLFDLRPVVERTPWPEVADKAREEIRLGLTCRRPRRPLAELDGRSAECQWWLPNAAGHGRVLRAGGFEVQRTSRPHRITFGAGHPGDRRLFPAERGVAHSAALARPVLT